MIRFLRLIFHLGIIGLLAFWLADRPGTAQIEWHGIVVETSAAVLALGVLAVAIAIHTLLRLWNLIIHGPVFWKLRRRIDKLERGEALLVKGLEAIASGNATEAGRLAVSARKSSENGIEAGRASGDDWSAAFRSSASLSRSFATSMPKIAGMSCTKSTTAMTPNG